MKCSECGSNIQEDWNYCPNCHNKLDDKIIDENIEYVISVKEKRLVYLFLVCLFLPIILVILLAMISNILQSPLDYYEPFLSLFYLLIMVVVPSSYIVALILIINGKNKYPKNKTINMLFKIYFALFIVVVVLFSFVVTIGIIDFLESCKTMG